MATNILRYDRDTAFPAVAAATLLAGTPVAFDSNGQLVKADANNSLPCCGVVLKNCVANDVVAVMTRGVLQDSSWTWTKGARQFLSTTAGEFTETMPNTNGDTVQVLGMAQEATKMIFILSLAITKFQTAGNSTAALL